MSRLTCLKLLIIMNCNLLEGVFEMQEPKGTKKSIDLLPSLRHLELIELPNLQYIWEDNFYELSKVKNIEKLDIRQCPKLKIEYPMKVLRQLEMLTIDLRDLKEIPLKEKTTQMLELEEMETSKVNLQHHIPLLIKYFEKYIIIVLIRM